MSARWFLFVATLALSPSAFASAPAAGVVLGVSGHVAVEKGSAGLQPAQLGMRLEAQDVVVVDRGGSAEIYLKGGGVVRLHESTRFAMPKAPEAAAGGPAAKLTSGSIAQLESGLWVLNDPEGSLLVSPMRGDGAFAADATIPLTPRYEALAVPSATFVWSGGPGKARVVVAKQRDVVWRSSPAAPGTVLAAGDALPLAAGEVYTWWLEPEAGGAPLTAGIPFRVAAADVIERTRAVEKELASMPAMGDGGSAADYLRVAHYTGAGSWTRVLTLASRMPESEARKRALAAAAAGLRLDDRTAAGLAAQLTSSPGR